MSDAPPTSGTAYDQVLRLKAEGVSRADAIEKLKATGLDEESAKVLVNSVMGPLPSELPSAQLTQGTDLLSPSTFTLSDIGLTGPTTTVGLYWMGFGAALLLSMGVFLLLTAAGFADIPDGVLDYALRLGGVAAALCIGWGAFRYSRGVRVRRR